jgi:hypothetical protein
MNIKMLEYNLNGDLKNLVWLKTKPQTQEMKQRISTLKIFIHHKQEQLDHYNKTGLMRL